MNKSHNPDTAPQLATFFVRDKEDVQNYFKVLSCCLSMLYFLVMVVRGVVLLVQVPERLYDARRILLLNNNRTGNPS